MNKEITFIPDRLNEEPIIYIGMTNSELKSIGLVSVCFWVVLCLILSILLGYGILGLAVGMAMSFLTIWLIGKKLRVLKRGKPNQYHVIFIIAWLEDHGLKVKTMVRSNEVWDIHHKLLKRKRKHESIR